ncbi:ABC transporter substrate-binding protein [Brachybacterium saurashtrense]|uniref:Extracellular solute-binding protein n=1 Tax=Brachybacterium saurashtrense TaxID=556288 RepID=A0A345YQY7_9MICO|nr:extracellular solute-binding protein [Brachybacterium saurashtrense]AXK46339.1 extracellular solute-binding protein [Brachybacterium saurashtrense]RRR24079.1 extracellular solute-binding protein [Brachybacterium saurashtrense]
MTAHPPLHASRRTVLGSSLTLLALAACGPNASGGDRAAEGDGTMLRFGWWGNATRDELTQQALDAYQEVAPEVSISPEPGDWSGYWDKLATQVAGGDAPDVIQMDESYLAEYSSRGILADLGATAIATDGFDPSALEAGKVDGGLYAMNAGINAPVLLANPALFEEAGVEMPDDTTWTWDDLVDIATRISEGTPEGTYGCQQLGAAGGPPLTVFLRQLGGERFSADGGIGYTAEQLAQWWDLTLRLQDSGAAPEASIAVEETGQSVDQSLFAVGKCALQAQWSNQVVTLDAALDGTATVLRMPSMTGSAADAKLWYKASMYFAVAETTANLEASAAFVDWMVNSPDAGTILQVERGVPANLEVRAAIAEDLTDSDRKAVDFIEAIAEELGDPPPITPPGGSAADDAISRHAEDVLFGRSTPDEAAQAAVEEATGALA